MLAPNLGGRAFPSDRRDCDPPATGGGLGSVLHVPRISVRRVITVKRVGTLKRANRASGERADRNQLLVGPGIMFGRFQIYKRVKFNFGIAIKSQSYQLMP